MQMIDIPFVLKVVFYRSETGNEPVREWLKDLHRDDKRQIGENIKTAQLGWPLGMPLIKKIDKDLWEVRRDWQTALHGFSLRLTASI